MRFGNIMIVLIVILLGGTAFFALTPMNPDVKKIEVKIDGNKLPLSNTAE